MCDFYFNPTILIIKKDKVDMIFKKMQEYLDHVGKIKTDILTFSKNIDDVLIFDLNDDSHPDYFDWGEFIRVVFKLLNNKDFFYKEIDVKELMENYNEYQRKESFYED